MAQRLGLLALLPDSQFFKPAYYPYCFSLEHLNLLLLELWELEALQLVQ
jgi:predicted DNA-binding protein (UPF0251 family)